MKELIGKRVKANNNSNYNGLIGTVLDIKTGEDKETDNPGFDIYVSFESPDEPEIIDRMEFEFSLLYGETKKIDDLGLDEVIMNMDQIEFLI